jgi:nitroreductase
MEGMTMSNILDTIFSRRSIRIYDRKKLDKETITDLLKAAMAAPSASNSRPWEFVVVTDEAKINTLRSKIKYGNYNAPAIIIVCGNTAIAQNESAFRYWVQDCSAATENILLAAAGLGLGTCWVASYPKEDVMAVVREMTSIPETVIPFNLIYVGYPAEEKAPRTQFDAERVHWDTY